jgi:hypothetical protein
MERPIKAKLRNPDSFKFYLGTPFELTKIQGVEYRLSAIDYGAQNGFCGGSTTSQNLTSTTSFI